RGCALPVFHDATLRKNSRRFFHNPGSHERIPPVTRHGCFMNRTISILTLFSTAVLLASIPQAHAYHPKEGDYGVLTRELGTPPYLGTLPMNLNAGEPPQRLSETHAFASTRLLKPTTDLVPYRVAVELWSDAAVKTRWVAVPGSAAVTYRQETEW